MKAEVIDNDDDSVAADDDNEYNDEDNDDDRQFKKTKTGSFKALGGLGFWFLFLNESD